MTDVADIAAAGEPVPRDHGSDVIMELSSPTPHDVVKAEVVDCTVDARSGLDGDAAEQRRLGSRDHSTAVSVDDDGDVIDAAMTDVADVAAAGEPVPRDHGSDVVMTSSSPTPRDVVKAEVVNGTVDARSGLDGDAAEQRRPGSRNHTTAVSIDHDGASTSHFSGAQRTVSVDVEERLCPTVDDDIVDDKVESMFPSDLASAASAASVRTGARLTSEQAASTAVDHVDRSADQRKTSAVLGQCRVCGDEATGMYFGALVCVPCKTFFLRYTNDDVLFTCRKSGDCDISVATRTQCKHCRYRKCLRVGMCRRVRPTKVEIAEGQLLCVVCGDIGNGVHFGAVTCEGCKKFFRRGLVENATYSCKLTGNCVINPRTRNACRYCRFQKCLESGMSRTAIQMGRPSKSRSSNETSTTTNDVIGSPLSSPVNLSFHRSAAVSSDHQQQTPAAVDGLTTAQQPDSTVDRCPLMPVSRKRPWTFGSVLRQLQSPTATKAVVGRGKLSASLWSDGGENVAMMLVDGARSRWSADVAADLRVKRCRYDGVQSPARGVQLPTAGVRASTGPLAGITGRRWSHETGEDAETCPAAAVYDAEVGSPSVTSSGRRESLDDDDDEDEALTVAWSRNCTTTPAASSTDLCRQRRASSVHQLDKKETDGHRDVDVCEATAAAAAGEIVTELLDLDRLMAVSTDYWLRPRLPDENVMFADVHWEVIKRIIPAYDRFVNLSTTINRSLSADFDTWIRYNPDPKLVPKWIQNKVIPAYTILSVAYCKSLPGFSSFDTDDQITIVRLGQSSSRVLVAALHWYDSDRRNFRNFLSWRAAADDRRGAAADGLDLFKEQLIAFSEVVIGLELDPVEAAMLNVLLITASDFPNLRGVDVIEESRQRILSTFRAYTTAKYGTPNYRLETIFNNVPDARRLGLLHYMMTTTQTMTAEEVESRLKAC